VKGEITLLIGKGAKGETMENTSIEEAVAAGMREGLSRMDAVKAVAKRRGLSKREVYAQTLAGRDE
jgi:16S rRNA C1402 (ribose-2'-O) methylase RsmI